MSFSHSRLTNSMTSRGDQKLSSVMRDGGVFLDACGAASV